MKYAVCNELFGKLPFAETCRLTAAAGFTGLEIAPFTLDDDPTRIPPSRVAELRRTLDGEGLACAGLHWLLAAPAGLHVTTGDDALRARSWDALARIAALCASLGGTVMVFGSPKQRSAPAGGEADARRRFVDGLRALAPALEREGVKMLVEALSPDQTNLVTSFDEAAEVIADVGSPFVQGMFDFHNAREEKRPAAEIIDTGFGLIAHVHLNTVKGSYPTEATPAHAAAFAVLRRRAFAGWVSLEIFHYDHPPAQVLQATLRTIRSLESAVDARRS
jgi:D-psicose/D-tagatose/L-ribulose 3-epimerase